MDKLLRSVLRWHVEQVGVAVVVVEGRYLFLSDLLDSVAVLEHLDLMELHLVHILRFADTPWTGSRLLH